MLTRTVTAATPESGYVVGDSETRYLLIRDDGTLLTSDDEAVFDGGDSTKLSYHWDGATFGYDPIATTYDCSDADGNVLVADAYDVSYEVTLLADDAKPSGLTGTFVLTLTPPADLAQQVADAGCPAGGDTAFDATLTPRHT